MYEIEAILSPLRKNLTGCPGRSPSARCSGTPLTQFPGYTEMSRYSYNPMTGTTTQSRGYYNPYTGAGGALLQC